MALNLSFLEQASVSHLYEYNEDSVMLYALSVGAGADPTDPAQLQFTYESGLKVLPTMAVVMGARMPFIRDPRSGINMKKMLHGETGLTVHAPLPVSGTVRSDINVCGIVDLGVEKGARVYFRHEVSCATGNTLYATESGCFIMRDGGGCGNSSNGFEAPRPYAIPDRAADSMIEQQTLAQAALIYRLTGDKNPLHVDPAFAKLGNFERPILHGSCTYGMTGYALLMHLAKGNPERLRRFNVRFSAPFYPGEKLKIEIWDEGDGLYAFRALAAERDVVVLNNGLFELEEKQ